MALNTEWAINELREFVTRCSSHREAYDRAGDNAYKIQSIKDMYVDVVGRMPVIESIAERTWPKYRDHWEEAGSFGWDYDPWVRIANQLLVQLRRKEELDQNLGEVGPSLDATTMHPNVWDASKSLWRNGHFGEAVSAASRSVNAAMQAKVGRRDASDMKLVTE